MTHFFSLFLFLFFYATTASAQINYPKPPQKSNSLFYIQHNKGLNAFVYEANIGANHLFDVKTPVNTYRILFDEDGASKPLTTIQKQFAYGIKSKNLGNNVFELRIVSYPDQLLYLKADKNGKPYIETTLNGQKFNLQRIFLKQREGTLGLNIKVDYLMFFGVDDNGNKIQEKLIP